MKFSLVCLAVSLSLWADERVHVTGTVFLGVSQQKLQGVRVYLTPTAATSGSEPLSVVTKADGRFEFSVLAGKYNLAAESPGIYRQSFGGRNAPPEIGVSIIAQPGLPTEELRFPLFPPASIQGRIVDAHGEPAENALVQILRTKITLGKPRTTSVRWTYTNDLGEFRCGLLPAGTYFVAVTAEPWYASGNLRWRQGRGLATEGSPAFLPSYLPGTSDISQAQPVRLVSGQDSRADFTLTETTGSRINVSCQGCPEEGVLELVYDGIGHGEGFQQVREVHGGSGSLSGVPPGHYTLRVKARELAQARSAIASIDVQGSDLSVDLKTAEMPSVSGTVSMENGVPIPKGMTARIRHMTSMAILTGLVSPNGSFTIAGVLPGSYEILIGNTTGVYAKSVQLGGKETRILDVTNDSVSGVRLVAGIGVGAISGLVYENGKPIYGVLALLVPDGLPNEPDRYHGFQTDSDGSFAWVNIRPGSYRLFALPNCDFEYASPERLRPYMKNAKLIEVGPGDVFREKLDVSVSLK